MISGVDQVDARVRDPEFWRRAIPDLTLTVDGEAATPVGEHPEAKRLARDLFHDGYLRVEEGIDPAVCARLVTAIAELRRRQIPPVFLFAYDEPWLFARALSPVLSAVLGADFQNVPSVWTWWIGNQPGDDGAGWGPHRDRPTVIPRDGKSPSLTMWVPLTDAVPENGCIYCLPADLDTTYSIEHSKYDVLDAMHAIRALPARVGSALFWTPRLVHWGSKTSRHAKEPRVSLGYQFQRGEVPPFDTPLMPGTSLPPLERRLAIIGRSLELYVGHTPLTRDYYKLAHRLMGLFGAGQAT
jgi:hypothetical protein